MENAQRSNLRSKIDLLLTRLQHPFTETVAELSKVTAWQTHSVRRAMAVELGKKGPVVTSDKVDGVRHYRLVDSQ